MNSFAGAAKRHERKAIPGLSEKNGVSARMRNASTPCCSGGWDAARASIVGVARQIERQIDSMKPRLGHPRLGPAPRRAAHWPDFGLREIMTK
jgi:hypothetical protein